MLLQMRAQRRGGLECPKTGARIDALGLEPHPSLYLEHLWEIFDEGKRVLKPTGTCWVNLGDTFASAGGQRGVACDTSDTAPEGYQARGYPSQSLCDACHNQQARRVHNGSPHAPTQAPSPSVPTQASMEVGHDHPASSDSFDRETHSEAASQSQQLTGDHEVGRPHASQESKPDESSLQPQGACSPVSNGASDPSDIPTYGGESPPTSDASGVPTDSQGKAVSSGEPALGNQCTSGFCSQCGAWSDNLRTYIHKENTTSSDWSQVLKPKNLLMIPSRFAIGMQERGWWIRNDIAWAKSNPMPSSVKDRFSCTWEHVFMFVKGSLKIRTLQLADLPIEFLHFGKDLGAQPPGVGPIGQLCVRIATTVFNFAQGQCDFSLPPFYSEVWEEALQNVDGFLVAGLPAVQRSTVLAACLLNGYIPTKQFLQELYSLGFALADGNHFLIGGVESPIPYPPGVFSNDDTTIGVNHAGQICKFDFIHGSIITQSPSKCNYWFDLDAVRDAYTSNAEEHEAGVRDWEQPGLNERGAGAVMKVNPLGKNPGDCWIIPTCPFPEAHFAVYPPELIRKPIRAGCPQKCCVECGKPWERIVEKTDMPDASAKGSHFDQGKTAEHQLNRAQNGDRYLNKTIGWQPTCTCGGETRPGVTYDPFAGAHTTGVVCIEENRDYIGSEISADYNEIGRKRLEKAAMAKLFG